MFSAVILQNRCITDCIPFFVLSFPRSLFEGRGVGCRETTGMFTLGGWWGMDWQEKVIVQNCSRALMKPKNQPGGVVLAP